ncbi:hypothetical protein PHYSODRAFT_346831 [Phytophthora sojae]|uniref:BZIP domain-containing protein n=1 Tax=Phytophthora sojae (strain P6497) TaxID=1094619 RepID=G4ZPJ9_PHYSP|nr:hypothetical protein PHYSODRAFT_346831 [Phytophthora sojae]EGZ16311.1 hypothetical protein PHYSODRAFT_346831 [Phytophthora sojae]|eukprot:XP_009530060.1 hypothetical protein PHYSODRAFT_346831 [Phytophthora sojae]
MDKRDAASWLVYQRERHRINQTRYRERQNEFLARLVEDNRKVREEIAGLEQSRVSITPLQVTPREANVWGVAVEYFRLFRYGVPDSPLTTSSCVQLDFMRATMAQNVEVNGGRGAETMLKSWKGRARWFDDVDVELLALLKGPGDSVVASTKASITITDQTLRYVFPHLRSDEDGAAGAKKALIADRILGQQIVLYGSTIFGWDGDCNRVTSALAQSDMLTPMLALLGSLDDVALLFDKSLMLPDSKWKAIPKN